MASVEMKSVCKTYGNLEVLHRIDLSLDSGEFVVFVGPSRLRQVHAAPPDCGSGGRHVG